MTPEKIDIRQPDIFESYPLGGVTQKMALDYEVRSSWWAGYVEWGWLQSLVAKWYSWKVNLKWLRYQKNIELARKWSAVKAREYYENYENHESKEELAG